MDLTKMRTRTTAWQDSTTPQRPARPFRYDQREHRLGPGQPRWHPCNHLGRCSTSGCDVHVRLLHPAGVWDMPHSHVADAHLIVASGELRLGYGNQLDRDAVACFQLGASFTFPAAPCIMTAPRRTPCYLGRRSALGRPITWTREHGGGPRRQVELDRQAEG